VRRGLDGRREAHLAGALCPLCVGQGDRELVEPVRGLDLGARHALSDELGELAVDLLEPLARRVRGAS
jgi:hypothetical protein